MLDAMKLALLPRDKPLTIFETAGGFTCTICGAEQEPWAYRVRLPTLTGYKGLADPRCAADHGWEVR
jgi:hypothetical protein